MRRIPFFRIPTTPALPQQPISMNQKDGIVERVRLSEVDPAFVKELQPVSGEGWDKDRACPAHNIRYNRRECVGIPSDFLTRTKFGKYVKMILLELFKVVIELSTEQPCIIIMESSQSIIFRPEM